MIIRLDGKGDVGQQLLRALRAAMAEGRLGPGDRLPSTRDLAESLGVGRNAAIHAYEVLCREHLAESRVGAGTFVRAGLRRQPAPGRARSRAAIGVREPLPPRHDLGHTIPQVDLSFSAAWGRMLAKAAEKANPVVASPKGHPALRQEIAAHVSRRKGIPCSPDEILVIGDLPQAVSLLIDTLLEHRGTVVAEAPASARLRAHVELKNFRLREYGSDEAGVAVPEEDIRDADMAFLTPGCNPVTGVITRQHRLEALLAVAHRAGTYVVDVDLCADLASGPDVPACSGTAAGGDHVIHVGSIARSVSPLLRLAYVVARGRTLQALEQAVYCKCLSAPLVEQVAMKHCLETSKIDRLIRRARREAARRAELMRPAFAAAFGDSLRLLPRSGPWNLLAVPTEQFSMAVRDLAVAARASGLRVSSCEVDTCDHQGECLILGYAGLQLNEVKSAIEQLAGVYRRARHGARGPWAADQGAAPATGCSPSMQPSIGTRSPSASK